MEQAENKHDGNNVLPHKFIIFMGLKRLVPGPREVYKWYERLFFFRKCVNIKSVKKGNMYTNGGIDVIYNKWKDEK